MSELTVEQPADVRQALSETALQVHPPSSDGLTTRMARFTNGDEHARRRSQVLDVLRDVPGLEEAAARWTRRFCADRPSPFDLMPLARTLPVSILARAIGVPEAQVAEVLDLTAGLCRAPAGSGEQLLALLAGTKHDPVAAASVLFQAYDATAALIALGVLAGPHEPSDAPVRATRRTAVEDVTIADVQIPTGGSVWIRLDAAVAERRPLTFGHGPHACPGYDLARSLYSGVRTALDQLGLVPVPGQRLTYDPRPNLCLPERVMLERQ